MNKFEQQPPLVISYYTENTPYQLEVFSLIGSCKEWEIEAEIEGIPSEGTWERNCAIKPFYIRQKLMEKKRSVFWVDADACFKLKPDFSFLLQSDLSFREMKRFSNDKRFRYCSGSFFVNYTERALAFMDEWCARCQQKIDRHENLHFVDQITLVDMIDSGQQVKIFPLPISYVKIFDLDALELDQDKVVIEHHQASRRYRHWNV